jgi:hypothetical protein
MIELDFGHVQPAAVNRREVKLECIEQLLASADGK